MHSPIFHGSFNNPNQNYDTRFNSLGCLKEKITNKKDSNSCVIVDSKKLLSVRLKWSVTCELKIDIVIQIYARKIKENVLVFDDQVIDSIF